MDFSYVHIRYFIGYVYHICLQDSIQSTLSLCLRCQAMLLPMPLRPLLLTTRSGFNAPSGCCLAVTARLQQVGPGAISVVTSGQVEFAVCRKWGGVIQPPRQLMPCLFLTATYNQRVLSPGTSARPGDLACQTCLPCLLTLFCLVLWKFSVLNCCM